MKAVLWLASGSFLRVDGWGERDPETLTPADRELLAASALTMRDQPLALVTLLDNDGDPTNPIIVNLDHVMTVSAIKDE